MQTYHREMGITHGELFRLLPVAVGGRDYQLNDTTVMLQEGEQFIRIQFHPQQERKIASLILPVTHVEIEFSNHTQESADEFMHRFDLSYQRGGG